MLWPFSRRKARGLIRPAPKARPRFPISQPTTHHSRRNGTTATEQSQDKHVRQKSQLVERTANHPTTPNLSDAMYHSPFPDRKNSSSSATAMPSDSGVASLALDTSTSDLLSGDTAPPSFRLAKKLSRGAAAALLAGGPRRRWRREHVGLALRRYSLPVALVREQAILRRNGCSNDRRRRVHGRRREHVGLPAAVAAVGVTRNQICRSAVERNIAAVMADHREIAP